MATFCVSVLDSVVQSYTLHAFIARGRFESAQRTTFQAVCSLEAVCILCVFFLSLVTYILS